ncbi:MAG: class I SAM-dependent methyltransferase [Pyrodictiaceae archaeon]
MVSFRVKQPSVPWVPSREDVIEVLASLIKPTPLDIFYDVGCGDGRVAIYIAKRHKIRTKCIELRRELVERSIKTAVEENVADLVEVIEGDFFEIPLHDATIVYMYLLTSVNQKLKPKLERELRPGTIVITLDFPITGWSPLSVLELPRGWQRILYLYVRGLSERGEYSMESLEKRFPETFLKLDMDVIARYRRR